jgi:RNA polymerase sigma-70 factor (ECF subfamily)
MQSVLIGRPEVVEQARWLAQLAERDLEAIAAAYDRHHEAVWAFARRLLGDGNVAEDLVHDVFVLLPSVVHRLQNGRTLRSFLLGIAANRARHFARSAARERRLLERFAAEPQSVPEGPESNLQHLCLARALEHALDRLSIDHRAVFVLCAVEGHDSSQAAEILNISEATVRTRLYYARQKLRALLAKEGLK